MNELGQMTSASCLIIPSSFSTPRKRSKAEHSFQRNIHPMSFMPSTTPLPAARQLLLSSTSPSTPSTSPRLCLCLCPHHARQRRPFTLHLLSKRSRLSGVQEGQLPLPRQREQVLGSHCRRPRYLWRRLLLFAWRLGLLLSSGLLPQSKTGDGCEFKF